MRLQPLLAGLPTLGQRPRQPGDSPANGSATAASVAGFSLRRTGNTGVRSARNPYGSRLNASPDTPGLAPDRVVAQLKHRRHARIALKARRTRGDIRRWLLWLLGSTVGVSVVTVAALVALAPDLTDRGETWQSRDRPPQGSVVTEPLRVALDGEHFYQLDLDPRQVEFDLLRGWDREQEAFADPDALAFVSGPMYERYYRPDPRLEQVIDQTVQPSSPQRAGDQGYTVPLGDLKFGSEIWRGFNRAAAGQRAFIGIDNAGEATFGYGELTAERARTYKTFIGGLHVLYNDLQPVQPGYRGAYSKGVGQKIRYYLPRVRVVIGLRPDRRLEVLMSKDGLTLEETRELSRKRGLVAAYLPDHASKSRFIVPGVKGFSEEDANWISGGSVSYVHVPYMIRISRRRQPAELKPDPIIALPRVPEDPGCRGPLSCAKDGMLWAGDRSLSGLNRLMGVVLGGRSLPEPPITADPPITRWTFPPVTPTASVLQEDGNPTPQPWESAWAPHPDHAPTSNTGVRSTVAPTEVQDDMTQPIPIPADADEQFREQAFSRRPPSLTGPLSLPAPDDRQGIGRTAPLGDSIVIHQQPRLLPLPTLTLNPASRTDEASLDFSSIRPAAADRGTTVAEQPPSLPTLGLIPDPVPVLPRLDREH